MKERYERLGGHVELIVKHGVGHHPRSVTDPIHMVEYILEKPDRGMNPTNLYTA